MGKASQKIWKNAMSRKKSFAKKHIKLYSQKLDKIILPT